MNFHGLMIPWKTHGVKFAHMNSPWVLHGKLMEALFHGVTIGNSYGQKLMENSWIYLMEFSCGYFYVGKKGLLSSTATTRA